MIDGKKEGTPMAIKLGMVISSGIVGGGEQLALSIAEHISDDFKIYAVTAPGKLTEQFKSLGCHVTEILNHDNADLVACCRYMQFIRNNKIQIVHAHLNRASFHMQFIARIMGIPSVATMHGYDKAVYYKYHKRVIFTNHMQKRAYQHIVPRNNVIFNGIDLDKYSCATSSVLLEKLNIEHDKVISIVGRLHHNKGHEIFLEQCSNWIKKNNYKVVIAGEGTEYAVLEKRIADLGLTQNVFLAGLIDDIAGLLAGSSLLIHPSLRENQPLVISEALAAGVPCVVSDTGNNREIVEYSKAGFVYDNYEHLMSLADRILKNTDTAQKMRENGIIFSRKYLNVKQMAARHKELYLKLLKY